MSKNIDPRYSHDDIEPIKNYPAYIFRCFRKLLCFLYFGVGTLIIIFVLFPILHLFFWTKKSFRKHGHCMISAILQHFLWLMKLLHVSKIEISKEDKQTLRNLKSTVIIANHPSMLDVLHMFSFVRNADCIVKADLKKSLVSGIVRRLYITNDNDFDVMVAKCKECMEDGSNLIIFPEGTRTPRHGTNPYKKGAARIALGTGFNVQPVHIGGNDKYGLGKHDNLLCMNHSGPYIYKFKVLPQITMDKYKDLNPTIAAKHLTEDMKEILESVQE